MDRLSMYYILGILNVMTCQTDDCTIGKHETLPCCSNYFLDNGVCKDCLPGYLGMNCSSECSYPNYGQFCQHTCNCSVMDCNNVDGCQGNHSQSGTFASLSIKLTTRRKGNEQKSNIDEGSTNLTRFLSVSTSSETSLTVDNTNNQSIETIKPDNEILTIVILLVGCVLTILLAINLGKWISKLIRRKCTNMVNAEDNDHIETVYIEINPGSDQQESEFNTTSTVITRSHPSIEGVETSPELPARKNQ